MKLRFAPTSSSHIVPDHSRRYSQDSASLGAGVLMIILRKHCHLFCRCRLISQLTLTFLLQIKIIKFYFFVYGWTSSSPCKLPYKCIAVLQICWDTYFLHSHLTQLQGSPLGGKIGPSWLILPQRLIYIWNFKRAILVTLLQPQTKLLKKCFNWRAKVLKKTLILGQSFKKNSNLSPYSRNIFQP